jgi:cell division protein FtsQ
MWHNVRLLNSVSGVLFVLALLAVVSSFSFWFASQPMFIIRDVEVRGSQKHPLQHVSASLIKNAVNKELASHQYFFEIPIESIRTTFEQLPWVRLASVRRVWPNKLEIEVEEHVASAVWGDGRLVNMQGELFSANLAEAEENGPLPAFSGPDEASAQVLRRYAELVVWLAPLHVKPESVSLSTRHAWTVRLDDGTTLLLGREQGVAMEDRINRWVSSVPRLQARLVSKPELYDLRYPNGFAVRAVALSPNSP